MILNSKHIQSFITMLTFYQLIHVVVSFNFTLDNSKDSFANFKQKYNKVYGNNSVEVEHFKTFVSNLNEIEKLNKDDVNNTFSVNQFTDLDPTQIEARYALQIQPYDIIPNATTDGDVENEMVKSFNSSELYDLDESEQLYKNYVKEHKKKKHKSRFERLKHYYRFVKTLVTINRERQEGKQNLTQLDENADQLKEPLEYMFY